MLEEFKKFISRGNVIYLAVGVMIGAAFGKITTSLVNDILMPPIGMLLAGVDFSQMSIFIGEGKDGPVLIKYGLFIQTMIEFVIIAFAILLFVKVINNLRDSLSRKEEAEMPAEPSNEEKLLTEIRDLLKGK